MSSVTSGASVVKKVGRTLPDVSINTAQCGGRPLDTATPTFSRVFRLGRHPFERLEIGLQTATLGIARDPFDVHSIQVLAGGDESLRKLIRRQVDDEIVNDRTVAALLDDLHRVDVPVDTAKAVATAPREPGRSGRVTRIKNTGAIFLSHY